MCKKFQIGDLVKYDPNEQCLGLIVNVQFDMHLAKFNLIFVHWIFHSIKTKKIYSRTK